MYVGWGYNVTGKLGTNTTDRQLEIGHYVELYSKLNHISLIHGHVVFVSELGELYVSGSNKYGQLGLGHVKNVVGTPVSNHQIRNKKAVATASCGHGVTLLLLVDHSLYLCGMDPFRKLGGSKTMEPKRIQQIGRHIKVIDIAVVHNTRFEFPRLFVVVTKKGHVFYLPLTTRSMHAAKRVWGPEHIVQICGGDQQVVALSKEGRVYNWMFHDNGAQVQVVLPPNASSIIPALQHKTIVEIAAGYHHCLALSSTGELYSWGRNTFGQLGVPHLSTTTTVWHASPVRVAFPSHRKHGSLSSGIEEEDQHLKISSIAAGAYHSVAVDEQGRVFTWGRNNTAQLGEIHRQGNDRKYPVPIEGLERISHVFAGGNSVIAARAESLWNQNLDSLN